MSPSRPYRFASSVAVLLASPKLGAVKRTFLLCSKGTLSLCRVMVGQTIALRGLSFCGLRDRNRSRRLVPRHVLGRFHPGVHAAGIGWRNSRADAADAFGSAGQSFGELPPGVSAVGRFVETTARSGVAAAGSPRRTARGPHTGEDNLRIMRIENEVHASDVLVFVQTLLESLAAVERTEDAALGVGAVGMSLGRNEEAIGILGVDDDGCDLLRFAQSQMLPGAAGIGRFVDTIAYGEIGAAQAFTTSDIDCVGACRRHGQG